MNKFLKGLGYALGGLVGLVLIVCVAVYGFSEVKFRKQYAVTPPPPAIPTDAAALARGDHLVHSIAGCADCHGENLAGKAIIDDPALGRIYAMNITKGKGGVGGTLSDEDYVRAIRHGIAQNGTALKIMPSSDYMNLSDEDLVAIIAYVKTVPPVDNVVPPASVGPVGRALFVAGKLPILHAARIDHDRRHIASVPVSSTAGYGAYLASFGCKGCHGPNLAGGPIVDGPPDWPQAANLTPAGPTKEWTEDNFKRLLREGKRPDGTLVNEAMPWRVAKHMTDDEIHAVFLYIKLLPPMPTGGQQTVSR